MQKLYRSRDDKKIAGVCGGIAKTFNIDPSIVRIVVAVLIVCCGVGLIPYIICAIVIPLEPETQNPFAEKWADKVQQQQNDAQQWTQPQEGVNVTPEDSETIK